jgi:hypothetical protein
VDLFKNYNTLFYMPAVPQNHGMVNDNNLFGEASSGGVPSHKKRLAAHSANAASAAATAAAAVIEDEPECDNIFDQVARSQRDALEIYLTDAQKIICDSTIRQPTKTNRNALYESLESAAHDAAEKGTFKAYYKNLASLYSKLRQETCGQDGGRCADDVQYVKLCDESIDAIAAKVGENKLLAKIQEIPPPVSTEDIGLSDIFSCDGVQVSVNTDMLKLYMGFEKSPEEYLAETKRLIAFVYEYVGILIYPFGRDLIASIMETTTTLEVENERVKVAQQNLDKAQLKNKFVVVAAWRAAAETALAEAAGRAAALAETALAALADQARGVLTSLKQQVDLLIILIPPKAPTPDTSLLILYLPQTRMTPQFISSNLSGDKQTITENSSKQIRLEQLNISIPENLKQPYDIYGSGFVIERINSIQDMEKRIIYFDPELIINLERYTKVNLYYLELALKIIIKIEGIIRNLTTEVAEDNTCLKFLILAYLSCVKGLVPNLGDPPLVTDENFKKFILLLFKFMNKLKIRALGNPLNETVLTDFMNDYVVYIPQESESVKETMKRYLNILGAYGPAPAAAPAAAAAAAAMDVGSPFNGYTIVPIYRTKTGIITAEILKTAIVDALTDIGIASIIFINLPALSALSALAQATREVENVANRSRRDAINAVEVVIRGHNIIQIANAVDTNQEFKTNIADAARIGVAFSARAAAAAEAAAAAAAEAAAAATRVNINVLIHYANWLIDYVVGRATDAAAAASRAAAASGAAAAATASGAAAAATASGAAAAATASRAAALAEMYAYLAIKHERLRVHSVEYVCDLSPEARAEADASAAAAEEVAAAAREAAAARRPRR